VSAIYLMLPVSLLLAGIFLAAYIWSVRSGQFEDTTTPAMRILPEDKTITPEVTALDSQNQNKPT
jgi:cbb3-type cytochrome oxidase maturation protein